MKLQELPSPYRELAEMRRTDESDFLTGIFKWGSTPEGTDFWAKVNIGYLPEIPASSLQELAEWHKSKLLYKCSKNTAHIITMMMKKRL